MNNAQLIAVLASIILQASPLIIAVCGEILTERAGVVNLSLDGTMLMAAMTAFVVGLMTQNVWLGFLAAAVVGMIFAAIVAVGSIRLGQSQVAIGFVLALLGDDLSAFLGQNYTRMRGVTVPHFGIPLLKDIPVIGPIFFDHDVVVYFAMILIAVTWWWLNRTQPGLRLRGAGERPAAAFARGVNVNRQRYLYTILGGALVGIAGAAFSLNVKIGWSEDVYKRQIRPWPRPKSIRPACRRAIWPNCATCAPRAIAAWANTRPPAPTSPPPNRRRPNWAMSRCCAAMPRRRN